MTPDQFFAPLERAMEKAFGPVLRFTVPGAPVPTGRARVYRGRSGHVHGVTPPRTQAYEELVAWHALAAMRAHRWERPPGPFTVTLHVYRAARRGDVDNYAKGLLDGMTRAGVWGDDREVGLLITRLDVDRTRPRVEVFVTTEERLGTRLVPRGK